MVEPWISHAVVAVFAFLTGVVLALFGLVSASLRKLEQKPELKQFSSLQAFLETARSKGDEGLQLWSRLPTTGRSALVAFYGLLLTEAIVLKYTPITLSWLTYFLAFSGGFSITVLLFQKTLHAKRSTSAND